MDNCLIEMKYLLNTLLVLIEISLKFHCDNKKFFDIIHGFDIVRQNILLNYFRFTKIVNLF